MPDWGGDLKGDSVPLTLDDRQDSALHLGNKCRLPNPHLRDPGTTQSTPRLPVLSVGLSGRSAASASPRYGRQTPLLSYG
jgi:hypothetical protein